MRRIELFDITNSELLDILERLPMYHRLIKSLFQPNITHLRKYIHTPEFAEFHLVYLYTAQHHLVTVVTTYEEVSSQCAIEVEAWNNIGAWRGYSVDSNMEKRIIQALKLARDSLKR